MTCGFSIQQLLRSPVCSHASALGHSFSPCKGGAGSFLSYCEFTAIMRVAFFLLSKSKESNSRKVSDSMLRTEIIQALKTHQSASHSHLINLLFGFSLSAATSAFAHKTIITLTSMGFPGGSMLKSPLANAGNAGSIPGSERSPGGRSGNPLQYSCLENPMDRGG